MRLRRTVETLGKYFFREMGFDHPPFDAELADFRGRPNEADVVLFDAQRVSATFPIAAGAAGLSVSRGIRVLDWIWLHPFERGTGLMDAAWADLEAVYGDTFRVRGPLSRAMRGFLQKRKVASDRWKATG
ncbi:hypothetical protein ACFYY2_29750 [Streptomyces sp. NPDC001822]|uniref:hypothetical protein n=1 Tax=Streptomyces sp. NPDC001822 TaxID=3364614 RepID=UPI0036965F39